MVSKLWPGQPLVVPEGGGLMHDRIRKVVPFPHETEQDAQTVQSDHPEVAVKLSTKLGNYSNERNYCRGKFEQVRETDIGNVQQV